MLKKLLSVFTQQYKEETKYIEYIKHNINLFKLNDKTSENDVEDKINRLIKKNFKSNFKVSTQ